MRLIQWLTSIFKLTLGRAPLYCRIRNRISYPNLGIADDVICSIGGQFRWGSGTDIGEGSVLVVPEDSTLILGNRCYIGKQCEIGADRLIVIGDQTSIQDRTVVLGNVKIGRYCVFSYNIYLSSGRHHFRDLPWSLIRDQDDAARVVRNREKARDQIVIEDDCWIGINVVIQPGVRIGKGCVVGANAVVTKDLPPYSIAAGVPAKSIGVRLDFRPPREIAHDQDENLPYFYRGFLTSKDELTLSRPRGGITSFGGFALSLDCREATEVHVRARSLGAEEALVKHGGIERTVGHEPREYSFPISSPKGVLEFEVGSGNADIGVIVERARVS